MFHNPTLDMIVVLVVVLLILGPKRLPGLGKSLGQGMREFKDSITGDSKGDDADRDKPAIARAASDSEAAPGAAEPPAAPARGSAERGSERRS